jgi:hypothetical protein
MPCFGANLLNCFIMPQTTTFTRAKNIRIFAENYAVTNCVSNFIRNIAPRFGG